MKILDMEQGSDEWIQARLGLPSASGPLLQKVRKDRSASSKVGGGYFIQLLTERLTGMPVKTGAKDDNRWTEHGHLQEPRARSWANLRYAAPEGFQQVGFCLDDEGRFGCSPDGLNPPKREGLELKCPKKDAPHLKRILDEKSFLVEHGLQCHFGMMVTGYDAWWLISWHAVYPPVVLYVERDQEIIDKLYSAAVDMHETLDESVAKIRAMDKYGNLEHIKDPDDRATAILFG